jgi:hypothetical protein
MKYYHHVNNYTKKKIYFRYIKFFSWLHVIFLTRSRELSTLPCLHPLVKLRAQNIYKKCKCIYVYERIKEPIVGCNLTFPSNVNLIGTINVSTLALGSRPRQGLAREWDKMEARECRRV